MRNRSAIVGIAIAILAVALWRFVQPAPAPEFRLTQLTFDAGLTGWPAISPDGRMLAYASDRDTGSNLSVYVQPVHGGAPVRLSGSGDNSEPSFSPDGARVVFVSGTGIFTKPLAGGDAHQIAKQGHTPRYSPDGRWISYVDGAGAYIVAATGGSPRPFHAEFQPMLAPSWSPDGKALVFWARGDLWVAKLDGGEPESTGLAARLAKAGLGGAPVSDGVWTSTALIFSARTGAVRNLYRGPVNHAGKTTGDVIRITNGTDLMSDPSVSRDGRVVFTSARQRFDVWAIPLDGARGWASGPPYRLTDSYAAASNPDISADGKRLIFGSSRNGFTEIWEKELTTGAEWVAVTSPEGATYGRLMKTGNELLYVRPTGGQSDVYLGNRKLASGTRAWDADSKGATVLMSGAGIDAVKVATGERTPLLRAPSGTGLSDASFSPDDRWVMFVATAKDAALIYVAPAGGGEWQPVTEGIAKAGKPRFSTDGRFIYYSVEVNGALAIDAVPFDEKSGRAGWPRFNVFKPSGLRLSLAVNPQALDFGIARDKLATILCEQTATIWIGDPVL